MVFKLVGRPPIFKEKVHKATGLTMDQHEYMRELSADLGVSQSALLRCAVTLFMRRQKEPVTQLSKAEMNDLLDRIKSLNGR